MAPDDIFIYHETLDHTTIIIMLGNILFTGGKPRPPKGPPSSNFLKKSKYVFAILKMSKNEILIFCELRKAKKHALNVLQAA